MIHVLRLISWIWHCAGSVQTMNWRLSTLARRSCGVVTAWHPLSTQQLLDGTCLLCVFVIDKRSHFLVKPPFIIWVWNVKQNKRKKIYFLYLIGVKWLKVSVDKKLENRSNIKFSDTQFFMSTLKEFTVIPEIAQIYIYKMEKPFKPSKQKAGLNKSE